MLYNNNRIKLSVLFVKDLTESNSPDFTFLVECQSPRTNDKQFYVKFNKKKKISMVSSLVGMRTTIEGYLVTEHKNGCHIRLEKLYPSTHQLNLFDYTFRLQGSSVEPNPSFTKVEHKPLIEGLQESDLKIICKTDIWESATEDLGIGSLINISSFVMADSKYHREQHNSFTTVIINKINILKINSVKRLESSK